MSIDCLVLPAVRPPVHAAKRRRGITQAETITSENRAGAGEGPDADADGKPKDESERAKGSSKTQDAAKAGRKDFDPNAGQA